MSKIETINYTYLGVSVVLLIITYYTLRKTKSSIQKIELDESNIERKSILVKTKNGDIKMDPNIFEMHMNRMKKNIIKLNENLTASDCVNIKEHLIRAKKNTKSYINLNYNNVDSDFCDMGSRFKLVDDYILQERELLRKKLSNRTQQENIDDSGTDNLRYSLLELLIDIDIILFLIRSSLCKQGKLDLSIMDQLLLELYRTNCMDPKNKKMLSELNDFEDDYITPTMNVLFRESFSDDAPNMLKHIDVSQHMHDKTTTTPYKSKISKKYKNEKNLHLLGDSRLDVISHSANKGFRENRLNDAMTFVSKPANRRNAHDFFRFDPRNSHMIDKGSRSSLADRSR